MSGVSPNDAFADTPTRPPFDPEYAPFIAAYRAVVGGPLSAANVDRVRRIIKEGVPGAPKPDLTAGGRVQVQERAVPGAPGDPEVGLLILSPVEQREEPIGCIYYIHGGGMVLGDREMNVDMYLPFVRDGHAVVVSVEYRLAPEHPDRLRSRTATRVPPSQPPGPSVSDAR